MDNINFTHGGNIHEIEKKYKKKLIDFSANINPLGIPPQVKKCVSNYCANILHYPDIEAENVKESIRRHWNISKNNIIIGNGSIELIHLLMQSLMPRTISIPTPTFSEYERAARCVRSKITFIPLKERDNFQLNLSEIPKSEVLFLCNPNNPTGNLLIKNPNLIDKIPAKLIIIDEAFMDFLKDEKKLSLINVTRKNKKIVILRTFTKFFAIPGLRIGYLIAHNDIVTLLRKRQIPWSVNVYAQKAGELTLTDKSYIRKTKMFVQKEKDFLFYNLTKIKKLFSYPSETNFILLKIKSKSINAPILTQKLIQKGILIRNCDNFRGLNNKFIRIAVRNRPENIKLINALKEII
jgi:threonine-phosphate decarboxylase